jgi:translation initiation factor 2B subunit (eIF-2B alpha/beta/delta family)
MWTRNPNAKLVSIRRTAVMLGVCERTVMKAIARGELRTTEFCDRRYVLKSEIDRLIRGSK